MLPNGTAFLVGRRTMMTASHVVYAWLTDRGACRIRVQLEGTWYVASRLVGWTDEGGHWLDTDVATFSIEPPSNGRVFRVAASPSVGSRATAVGFPLGESLHTLAGTVSRRVVVRHTPLVVVRRDRAEGGNSGSPILDEHDDVVSLVSRVIGVREDIAGIDLREWWGQALAADLCKVHDTDRQLGCDSEDDTRPPTKIATPFASIING